MPKIAIVTATTRPTETCSGSWYTTSTRPVAEMPLYTVINGVTDEFYPEGWSHTDRPQPGGALEFYYRSAAYLGTVPAFRIGVDQAIADGADIIACLHDDVELLEQGWDEKVIRHFERTPVCGLAGFGGAIGLGAADIYQTPYDPMQLARIGFRSNMVDAEVHGMRSLLTERVACLDGFSQIGRREFWRGVIQYTAAFPDQGRIGDIDGPYSNLFSALEKWGIVHHIYDGALGAFAARLGWETWYLPIRCRHYGGRTAVGDPGYAKWAEGQVAGGDQGFWKEGHRIVYDAFRDVLPLRV